MAGVKKSYMFHSLLFGVRSEYSLCSLSQLTLSLIQREARGFTEVGSSLTALLAHLYSLLRSNKQHRRAFLRALLRYFEDYEVREKPTILTIPLFLSHSFFHSHTHTPSPLSEQKNPLGMLLYVADNLAYCPYSTLEEPLFVVHHIDMSISVSGSNILQAFREVRVHGHVTVM